jgi:hypothetical protein
MSRINLRAALKDGLDITKHLEFNSETKKAIRETKSRKGLSKPYSNINLLFKDLGI